MTTFSTVATSAVVAFALAVLTPHAAGAQGSDAKAAAEALFREGRTLMEKGDLAAACGKFEASQKLDPSVGTLINLASCYEQQGRVASAWVRYREVAELAARSGQAKREKYAGDRALALEARLPRLQLQVSSHNPPGLEVKRNGDTVDRAAWGSTVPVDPGEITIDATASGYQPFSTKLTATEGTIATVEVPALEPDVRAAQPSRTDVAVAPNPAESPREGARMSRGRLILSISTGVAGLALTGVGIGFGLSARSKWSDAQDLCVDDLCDPAGVTLGDHARTAARVSTVLVGVGVLAVGAGVVLYLTGRPDDEQPHQASAAIAPTAIGAGPGVVVMGQF